MRLAAHPVWLVGFRPFFALACIAGAALPLVWALAFTGAMRLPPTLPVPPLQWHAHEMFYGFGWAVLAGFLLTSTKNWVGVRGHHGATLAWLAAAWLLGRIAMLLGGAWPPLLHLAAAVLFPAAAIALLLHTLIAHRARDSYRDNAYFIVALPLFLPAQWLLLDPGHFAAGWSMTLALFRLAFLVMLERTLTQFMKAAMQLALPRRPALDHAIKLGAMALAFAPWLPPGLAAGAALLLAALLLSRWLIWHPWQALRRLDIGIMYLGQLAIIGQLALEAQWRLDAGTWIGSVQVHLFTLGAMGLILPSLLIRISKGHTGRKVAFDALDRAVLWLMIAALAARVALPQFLPAAYLMTVQLAATCWLLAFGLLGWRIIPWLLRPRVDGKEH